MSKTLYILVPLFLLTLAFPLAILAAITSILAFSTLFIRVSIVYFELFVALLRSYLLSDIETSNSPPYKPAASTRRLSASSPSQQRKRKSSGAISIVEAAPTSGQRPPRKSQSFASLVSSSAPNRDFEGVGGWSLGSDAYDDAWTIMNSRLQLPTPSGEQGRRHRRSSTAGSVQRFGSGHKIGAFSAGARTPGTITPENYFTMKKGGVVVGSPEETCGKVRMLDTSPTAYG